MMISNYRILKSAIAVLAIFLLSACSSKYIEEVPITITRVATSEILYGQIKDIKKQGNTNIIYLEKRSKGLVELISLKSLDMQGAGIEDEVKITTRGGVSTNIDILKKSEVHYDAPKEENTATNEIQNRLIEEEQAIQPIQEDTIEKQKEDVEQINQEALVEMTDNSDGTQHDRAFDNIDIDTSVSKEDISNDEFLKRTIDRKNTDIAPPGSQKLEIIE